LHLQFHIDFSERQTAKGGSAMSYDGQALQQHCHDRQQRLRRHADAERLALQARGRRQRRTRRQALHATLELLRRRRHGLQA
jgi:hypothetical protein